MIKKTYYDKNLRNTSIFISLYTQDINFPSLDLNTVR